MPKVRFVKAHLVPSGEPGRPLATVVVESVDGSTFEDVQDELEAALKAVGSKCAGADYTHPQPSPFEEPAIYGPKATYYMVLNTAPGSTFEEVLELCHRVMTLLEAEFAMAGFKTEASSGAARP